MHDRHTDPEALRRLIAERDLSLAELGRRSNVSYTHLKEVRAGRRDLSDRFAARIARQLDVAVSAFTVPGPRPDSPPAAPQASQASQASQAPEAHESGTAA